MNKMNENVAEAWPKYDEKDQFVGLIPEANKYLPVIGDELEVADIDAIMNPGKGSGSDAGSAE